MRKGLLLLVLGLVAGLLLMPGQAALADSQSMVVAVDSPPVSMDPNSSLTDANYQVMTNFFDALVTRVGYEGKLSPCLAVKWERTGTLTWKVWLRQGVRFHNGNPFTAADVEFTFKRLLDPKCCSEFMDTGKGIASMEIIDDYTMIFTTPAPNPAFAENLELVAIMDKESTEKRDVGDIGLHPIGTGAYKLVEWVKGSYLKMEANEDYWGGAPSIKRVEWRPISESSTRFAALASGKVELISGVPVELLATVKRNKQLELITRPGRRSIFLVLGNQPGKPWADIRVRRAMYMAINEEEIAAKLMRGQVVLSTQLADPAETGYAPDVKRLAYDPAQAKKLMAEAGYADGFQIKLSGPNDRYVNDEKILEAVAKYLAKIGIKVKLDIKPKAVFFPEIVKGEGLEFYLLGWLNNTYDHSMSLTYLLHTRDADRGYGAWNGTRYSDPELDKAFEAADNMLDVDKRRRALEDCVRMYMADLAVIPLHLNVNTYAVRKSAGIEFSPRPDRWLVFKEIKKK